ncbi:MAG: hypothetical protein ACOCRK_11350 [bacterium]
MKQFRLKKYQNIRKCSRYKIPFVSYSKRRKYASLSVDFLTCHEKFKKITEDKELKQRFDHRVYKVFEPTLDRSRNAYYSIGECCSIDGIFKGSIKSTAYKIINIYEDLLREAERKEGTK